MVITVNKLEFEGHNTLTRKSHEKAKSRIVSYIRREGKLEKTEFGIYRTCNIDIKYIARVVRESLIFGKQFVKIKTKSNPSSYDGEVDIGVFGYFIRSNIEENKKPIEIMVQTYGTDSTYQVTEEMVSILVSTIFDTIAHELRHFHQHISSNGLAFKDSRSYYDTHYEIDAFAFNAINEALRINNKKGCMHFALKENSVVEEFKENGASIKSIRRLMKKIYKGVHNNEYSQGK